MKNILQEITFRKLCRDLMGGEWPERVRAAERLGELKDRRAVKALMDALAAQASPSGLAMAAGASGSLQDDQDRFLVRQAAAKALGLIGDPQAVPALLAALEDASPPVQAEAITALGLLGDEQAIPPIVSMLKVHEQEVRAAASQALTHFGEAPAKWVIELLRLAVLFDTRQAAAQALGLIGGPLAIQALAQALRDPDYQVGREAVESLARLGKPAAESLLPLLQDSDAEVRAAAAQALGKIRDTLAIAPLKPLIADSDQRVRAAVWHALALLNWPPAREREQVGRALAAGDFHRAVTAGPVAVEPLIEIFRDADKATREKITAALTEIGPNGTEFLLLFLLDMKLEVRRLAAQVLGTVGWTPQAPAQRVWLAIATGRFEKAAAEGPAAIPPLAELLKYEHEWDREMAAYALGEIRSATAVPLLAAALEDSAFKVRQAVARALGKIGGEAAAKILRTMLQDRDYNVRNAAREALDGLQ